MNCAFRSGITKPRGHPVAVPLRSTPERPPGRLGSVLESDGDSQGAAGSRCATWPTLGATATIVGLVAGASDVPARVDIHIHHVKVMRGSGEN
jgi:hypothetical protein